MMAERLIQGMLGPQARSTQQSGTSNGRSGKMAVQGPQFVIVFVCHRKWW